MKLLGIVAIVVAVWLVLKSMGKAAAAAPVSGSGEPAGPAQIGAPLPNDALDNIMQATYQLEGGRPGDRNVVNNNPGDVKSAPGMTGKAGGFATFADIGDGWDALRNWIVDHVSAHPDWDFYDMQSYYLRGSTTAPSVDAQGDSDMRAEYIANYLGVDPTTPVSQLLGV